MSFKLSVEAEEDVIAIAMSVCSESSRRNVTTATFLRCCI